MITGRCTIISSKNEMTKSDLIETILLIINKIIDYTSTLNQITPTLFDKDILSQENEDNGSMSTGQSSGDDNGGEFIQDKDNKEDKYTLTDYFYYWAKKLEFNENMLILTIMNIDKLLSKEFILTESNVKNVLFTSMVLTQKYYEDENFNDKDYSKIIGINTNELIKMQIEFLSLVDFSLHVTDEKFAKYKHNLEDMWRKTLSIFSFT